MDELPAFKKPWSSCVGSDRVSTMLRSEYWERFDEAKRAIGFRYIRCHGLLCDDMGLFRIDEWEGKKRAFYNFSYVDQVFDAMLEHGVRPFIELGFMPEALASGPQTCFHYKANISPPADYGEWGDLIRNLTRHLVGRYGLEEVKTWFFEVWNEPNLKFFWAGSQDEYFKLYEHAARAIKSVDAGLRVGGPASSINAWIPDMLRFCRDSGLPLDFVSTHHYPTDDPLWKNGGMTVEEFFKDFAHLMGHYDRGVLREMAARARSETGSLPLYYTEWNSSAMMPDPLHDEPYSAALVAKAIADNDGIVDGYSFWTFSDIFEERGQYSAPFHGGFGLQTVHGIPKPSYRVFELLHRLGDQRIEVEGPGGSTVELLAARGTSGLTILAYNHDVPGAPIRDEEVTIRLRGASPQGPVAIERVDAAHANARARWVELGCPEYLSGAELEEIEAASRLVPEAVGHERTAEGCVLRFVVPAHGVAALTLA